MIVNHSDDGYRPMVDGIERKTLVHGEATMMVRFRLAAGSRIPVHSHPHEQTGILLSGSGRFSIEGATEVVGPGDSWSIPGGVDHSLEVIEDSEIIEVFSPLREDYLD